MAPEPLTVLIAGRPAGVIDHHRSQLRLTYDESYAADPTAVPLSLSMPLSEPVTAGRRVGGWLSGLLPGNETVRRRWAAKHDAISHSPFDLLSTPIGLDCPGAVQTCPTSRLADLPSRPSGIDWLTPSQLRHLVDELVREQNWQRRNARSAWSLAGAQSKTALVRDGDRWGEPWGTTPSTHIFKPSMRDLNDQAINEHLCLSAARFCGIAAVHTEPLRIGEHSVLAVRRYDRLPRPDGTVQRVHQEDFHQACGEPDADIYQTDTGGHSISRLAHIIADHSAEPDTDQRRFFDALVFNWLTCNTDAHSKNYSLLLAADGNRLAPLYDMWSMHPYDPEYVRSFTMAMSALPDRRILAAENPDAWTATAAAVGLPPLHGPRRAGALAAAVPDAFTRAADELPASLRTSPIVHTLTTAMTERAQHCLCALAPARTGRTTRDRSTLPRRDLGL